MDFPGGSDGKGSGCNARDLGLIPGLRRSPGGGHGNPLQYSCLQNPHGEEPGGLPFVGTQRVRHDWATKYSTARGYGYGYTDIDKTDARKSKRHKDGKERHKTVSICKWHNCIETL